MHYAHTFNAQLLSVLDSDLSLPALTGFFAIRPDVQCILQYGRQVISTLAQYLCMSFYIAGVGEH
jgi:hypothetical protein